VLTVVVEKEGFGTPLPFVIARSATDRIDVAPIFFGLGMDVGIAVDFAC